MGRAFTSPRRRPRGGFADGFSSAFPSGFPGLLREGGVSEAGVPATGTPERPGVRDSAWRTISAAARVVDAVCREDGGDVGA